VALLEFAIVLPVFLLFVFGLLQMCLFLWGNSVISSVLSELAQQSAQGCISGDIDLAGNCVAGAQIDAAYISKLITERSLGSVDPSQLCLRADVLDSLVEVNGITQIPAGINLGHSEDAVVFVAEYQWPIIIPFVTNTFGGQVEIFHSTMIRNAPFGKLVTARRLGVLNGAQCPGAM
jgi:Flp pilus assembly protein TadG